MLKAIGFFALLGALFFIGMSTGNSLLAGLVVKPKTTA